MHPSNGSDWIARLPDELLLQVFGYDLTSATLAGCALCCKRWKRLAISVLYKHVVLGDAQSFSRWIATGPLSLDPTIETLTICISNSWTPAVLESVLTTMKQLGLDLDQLSVRLQQMVKLRSFSMSENLARGWIAASWTAKVLQNIPETCSSLELVFKQTTYTSLSKDKPHLCVSIRRLIPQLQALRLALPCICPESFGTVRSQSSTSTLEFTPVGAPKLQDCIIRLASPRIGGTVTRYDGPCHPDVSLYGIATLAECLLSLAASGQAPLLQKLWIRDALSSGNDPSVSYGAFVRRDVLANKSLTFPWTTIAISPCKAENGFLIRVPEEEGGQDLLTTRQGAEEFVEGHAWMTAMNGARLPATTMAKYRLPKSLCITQTREEWLSGSKISTTLWANEKDTGMRLLDAETGALLEDRPANFRIPEGWRRDPSGMGLERVP